MVRNKLSCRQFQSSRSQNSARLVSLNSNRTRCVGSGEVSDLTKYLWKELVVFSPSFKSASTLNCFSVAEKETGERGRSSLRISRSVLAKTFSFDSTILIGEAVTGHLSDFLSTSPGGGVAQELDTRHSVS